MSVFIKDKKKFKRHTAKPFKDEEELGRLIIDHPEIVPVDQFSELGGALIPITREMKLETGELDVLGINKEGEIFLLPPKVPHSPRRSDGSIGLVIEAKRKEGEMDGLLWYCENCNHLLHSVTFKLNNVEKDFQPMQWLPFFIFNSKTRY